MRMNTSPDIDIDIAGKMLIEGYFIDEKLKFELMPDSANPSYKIHPIHSD